jgi:photosystem II PsbU protein
VLKIVHAAAMTACLLLPACNLLHREHEQSTKPAERSAPLDLNTASVRRLEELPGITPSMARRIADGRPYESPHDLVDRGLLTEHEFDRVENRLTVERRER